MTISLRLERQDAGTAGRLFVGDTAFADTRERPTTDGTIGNAVLPGEYWLRMSYSPSAGRYLPQLFRVPNGVDGAQRPSPRDPSALGDWRDNVWIRDGRDTDADESIVLVPLDGAPDVDASRDLLDTLIRLLEPAILTPEGATITIVAQAGAPQTAVITAGVDLSDHVRGIQTS